MSFIGSVSRLRPIIEGVIAELPSILKQSIEPNGGQYSIRYYKEWVVKEPLDQPPLADGRILKAVNPQKPLSNMKR